MALEDFRNKLASIRSGKFPNFNESYVQSSMEKLPALTEGSNAQKSGVKKVSIQQPTKKQLPGQKTTYWTRFEALDEVEVLSGDDQGTDSEDGDIEMRDLEGRAAQNMNYANQPPINDEDMLNQEIEDIDSDDDQLLVM